MNIKLVVRRPWIWLPSVTMVALLLPACEQGGHFSFLGYSTRPNYNLDIKTVRVPIFKNATYKRGIEFDVTQAVIREIEQKTPYKVVSAECAADTELLGNIVAMNKTIVNFNQLGEVRDSEVTLTAEIIWRDLRAGHIGDVLSQPSTPGKDPTTPLTPGPGQPPPAEPAPTKPGTMPAPVLVQAVAGFQPELGGSLTTALNTCTNRMAQQIVSMMEKGW